jgi:hypothetical protein
MEVSSQVYALTVSLPGRIIWYALPVYLDGHQKKCGYFGKEKYLMPLLEIE